MQIKPKLEVLSPEQKELWEQLSCIPKDFVLYGGTAVALRYGHRESIDFDFFSLNRKFNLETIQDLPLFKSYSTAQVLFQTTISIMMFL